MHECFDVWRVKWKIWLYCGFTCTFRLFQQFSQHVLFIFTLPTHSCHRKSHVAKICRLNFCRSRNNVFTIFTLNFVDHIVDLFAQGHVTGTIDVVLFYFTERFYWPKFNYFLPDEIFLKYKDIWRLISSDIHLIEVLHDSPIFL